MDALSISAASGMRARMQSLELLANNLANTETGGYKADREFYSLFTSADATSDPHTGALTTLPVIQNHWTDYAQGEFRNTGNPLDTAIQGDGLFGVQTARGVRYTRNGSFRVSAAGALTTTDGSTLRGQNGAKIVLDPALPVEIQPDGSVLQGKQSVGRLEVVSFASGAINKEGANYFVAADGAQPKASTAPVLQGKLEGSNVAPAESAVRLVSILRQFEMLQKASTIANDLNKKAIEEVARV